jgi:hypothetical protein
MALLETNLLNLFYPFKGHFEIAVSISKILKSQRRLVKYVKKYFFYQIFVMRNRDFSLNSHFYISTP